MKTGGGGGGRDFQSGQQCVSRRGTNEDVVKPHSNKITEQTILYLKSSDSQRPQHSFLAIE